MLSAKSQDAVCQVTRNAIYAHKMTRINRAADWYTDLSQSISNEQIFNTTNAQYITTNICMHLY